MSKSSNIAIMWNNQRAAGFSSISGIKGGGGQLLRVRGDEQFQTLYCWESSIGFLGLLGCAWGTCGAFHVTLTRLGRGGLGPLGRSEEPENIHYRCELTCTRKGLPIQSNRVPEKGGGLQIGDLVKVQ